MSNNEMSASNAALSMYNFVRAAPDFYRTKGPNGRVPSVLLESAPGNGKSAMIERELPKRLRTVFGCKVAVVADRLPEKDPLDVRGIQIPYKLTDGTPAAAYTKADLRVRIERALDYVGDDGIVVVFLDELPASEQLMQKAIAPLALDGRLGDGDPLPPNVWVIAAGNRKQDGAGVGRMLSHLRNRVVTIPVYMNIRDDWAPWAESQGYPTLVTAFAAAMPEKFASAVPASDEPYLTIRSISNAGAFIRDSRPQWGGLKIDTSDFAAMAYIRGCIGIAATAELEAFANCFEFIPTVEEIEANPRTAKAPPADRVDIQYALLGVLFAGLNAKNINARFEYGERVLKNEFMGLFVSRFAGPGQEGSTWILNSPRLAAWMGDPANRRLLNPVIGGV